MQISFLLNWQIKINVLNLIRQKQQTENGDGKRLHSGIRLQQRRDALQRDGRRSSKSILLRKRTSNGLHKKRRHCTDGVWIRQLRQLYSILQNAVFVNGNRVGARKSAQKDKKHGVRIQFERTAIQKEDGKRDNGVLLRRNKAAWRKPKRRSNKVYLRFGRDNRIFCAHKRLSVFLRKGREKQCNCGARWGQRSCCLWIRRLGQLQGRQGHGRNRHAKPYTLEESVLRQWQWVLLHKQPFLQRYNQAIPWRRKPRNSACQRNDNIRLESA